MPERTPELASPAAPRAAKLWSARLPGGTAPIVEQYTSSVADDQVLGADDVAGSVAHARMLHEIGVLSVAEHAAIERGLGQIKAEFENGVFEFAASDEDVHSAVERRLFALAGEAAGKLHTGRSRNDQVATDLRMYAKRACDRLVLLTAALQEALVRRAGEHRAVILPGYTHGQRAQPVSLALPLLAYFEMLQRDIERYEEARNRCDVLPLGSGALAGSTLPLDRDAVARDLGFAAVAANSIDAVSDRDFVIDVIGAGAVLMTHVSRLCEDMILWTTSEFGFMALHNSHATGSSLMPQKKNPDVLELARGRSGRVIGDLVTMLTVVKGIPLAYDRDLQEDKRALFDAVDTVAATLATLTEVVGSLSFDVEAMRRAGSDPSLLATDVAEYLVVRGVPFREAHALVAEAVRAAETKGVSLKELRREDWQSISPAFDDSVTQLFDVEAAMSRRRTAGGPGQRSVSAQLNRARRLIRQTRRHHENRVPGAEA